MPNEFPGKEYGMKISGFATATVLGGLAVATLAAPVAAADDGCSAAGVANTISTVTGSAQQYLGSHPGAGQVLYAAMNQSPTESAADVRGYFTANPQEYLALRGILAPIGEVQERCNVAVLSPMLQAAYTQFMAG